MPMTTLHRKQLEQDWTDLVSLGPRFMGTPAAQAAVDQLHYKLKNMAIPVERQPFPYPAWSVTQPPELEVIAPAALSIDVHAFLRTGSTNGWVEGEVHRFGWLDVWGMYRWPRFAVRDAAGQTVAVLVGRLNGKAIPQDFPESRGSVPYLCLGRTDLALLERMLKNGPVRVRCRVQTAAEGEGQGENVIARVPAQGLSRGTIVLGAHYDTMYNTAGAYDNGTGTAAVLSLARQLRHHSLPYDLVFALFGGEEWSLAGSRHFVRTLKAANTLDQVRLALVLDGMGRGRTLEIWSGPEHTEEWLAGALTRIGVGNRRLDFRFPPPPGSDQAPFYAEGIPAVMLTFNDQEILHSPEDQPTRSMLQNTRFAVDMVLALLQEWAQADL